MKRLRLFFLGLLVLAVSGTALLWLLATPAADEYLLRALPRWARSAGVELELAGLDLDPWGAQLTLMDLRAGMLGAPEEWSVSVRRSTLAMRPLQSLFGVLHLEVSLEAPRVRGTVPTGGPGRVGREAPGGRFVLHTLEVSGGSVELHLPEHDLGLSASGIDVRWTRDAGGADATDVRVRWRAGEKSFGRVEFRGARKFTVLSLERVALVGDGVRVHAEGRAGPWRLLDLEVGGELDLGAIPEPWLEALRLQSYLPLVGDVALRGALTGSLGNPEFKGHLEVQNGRFGVLQDARLRAEVLADREGLRLSQVSGTSNLVDVEHLRGELSWEDEVRLRATGQVRNYRLRPFMGLFLEGYFPVGLTADAEIRVEGPLHPELALTAQGETVVRALDVTTDSDGERQLRFALPGATMKTRLTIGRDSIEFGPSRVESESVDVQIAGGRIRYREGLWFRTAGEIRSLALAHPLLPEWLEAQGHAEGQFGGPYRELEFDYDVDLDSVSLRGVSLGRLRGHGEYDLRELRLSEASLRGSFGELFAVGAATLVSGGEHAWDLRWEGGDLAAAAGLLRSSGISVPLELAGEVSSEGRLSGPLAAPEYSGRVRLSQLRADRFLIDTATVTGRGSPQGWQVSEAEFTAYGASGWAAGRGDGDAFEAETRLDGLQVETVLAALDVPLELQGNLSGRGIVSGPYRSPQVTLDGQLRAARAYGTEVPDSDLGLKLDRETLDVSVVALDGRLEGWFRRQAESGTLTAKLEADAVAWTDLPVPKMLEGLRVDEITAVANLAVTPGTGGWLRSVKADWHGRVGEVAWRDLDIGPVGIGGEILGGGIGFQASAWEQALRIDGLYSPEPGAPLELSVGFEDLSLGSLQPYAPLAGGVVNGDGKVLLSLEQWGASRGLHKISAFADLELQATLSELRATQGLDLPELVVRVSSPDGKPAWDVEGLGVSLRGTVEDIDHGSWGMQVRLDQFVPWSLLPEGHVLAALEGAITGTGRVTGAGRQVDVAEGRGRLEGLAWSGWGTSDWDWELRHSRSRFNAELREPSGVTTAVRWQPETGLALDLDLRDVAIERWLAGMGPVADLSGAVAGIGRLQWPPRGTPSAWLELSDLRLEQSGFLLASDAPVRMRWSDGTAHLDAISLSGDDARLEVSGAVEPRSAWDLNAAGRLELAALSRWFPQIERGEGRVEFVTEIVGPWPAPQIRGPIEILPGSTLKFSGFPIALEDLDAYGALDGTGRFTLDWLDAQVRDGRLHLEGGLDLRDWRPGDLRFYTEIRDLEYQWPAQVEYLFDADALITGTVAEPQVRGEVRLQRFLYRRRVDWRELVLKALQRKPRSVEARKQKGLFLDLAVLGREDVQVVNNLAELDLEADLRVRGHLPDPTIWGRVDVVDGAVTFRGREFEALQSTVEFLGDAQPVPQLDLHVQTFTRDYTVNVDVTGPLDDYQVGLSSVPYLSHTDIVALLTLGMTSQEVQGSENMPQAQAYSIIGEGLQEEFIAVGEVFGVDTFYIDPSYSPATQTTVPRVTIGKGITEELYVRYAAAIGAETQQDVELEYTLSPKLSLLGTWIDREFQDQGSLGGELRLRFPFR